MRMRRWLWGAGLLAVVGLGSGCAHDETKQARIRGEKVGEAFAQKVRFADQLSLVNQEQIVLGHIALRQSNDPEVRRFAEDLIRNHQRNQEDLERLAESKAFSLAVVDLDTQDLGIGGAGTEGMRQGMEKGDESYDKKYDEQVMEFLETRNALAGLSGREFDQAFLAEVKKGQERGEKLIDEGLDDYRDDTTLAMFLGRTAPVLESHQQRIATLKGYLGD
jgi:predicted outer membrane protein